MIDSLNNWKGSIEIDGIEYSSISAVSSDLSLGNCTTIVLRTTEKSSAKSEAQASNKDVRVTVRQYMTKKSTPDFDFMAKWNNDAPMPLRTMVGTIDKETPGMYHMVLHGDTDFTGLVDYCMKCGREITNPVSKFFGMGPECSGHAYNNPFDSDEELKMAVDEYKRNTLANIKWSGWVIKSAITKMEEI